MPLKNIGGIIYPKIPLKVTMKLSIVINLVRTVGGNHSTATDAYAFNIRGLAIPHRV
jgi:hypothetical protein